MREMKIFLSLTLIVLFAMASCNKEAVSPQMQEDITSQTEKTTPTTFTPADQVNTEEDMALLERILKGEFETKGQVASTEKATCCSMNSISKVTSPWGLVNLNLKYDVSTTSQQIQIKHWHKPLGSSSYTYYGMDVIGSSYTSCTAKSVNMSTGQLPDDGQFISWARIYNGSSYCGGSAILWHWTK